MPLFGAIKNSTRSMPSAPRRAPSTGEVGALGAGERGDVDDDPGAAHAELGELARDGAAELVGGLLALAAELLGVLGGRGEQAVALLLELGDAGLGGGEGLELGGEALARREDVLERRARAGEPGLQQRCSLLQ